MECINNSSYWIGSNVFHNYKTYESCRISLIGYLTQRYYLFMSYYIELSQIHRPKRFINIRLFIMMYAHATVDWRWKKYVMKIMMIDALIEKMLSSIVTLRNEARMTRWTEVKNLETWATTKPVQIDIIYRLHQQHLNQMQFFSYFADKLGWKNSSLVSESPHRPRILIIIGETLATMKSDEL